MKTGDCVRWRDTGWIGILLYPACDDYCAGVWFSHGSYDVAPHNLEVINEDW